MTSQPPDPQSALAAALSETCHHNDPGMGYPKGVCDEPWRHKHHAAAIIDALDVLGLVIAPNPRQPETE